MDSMTIGPEPVGAYYALTVSTDVVGIPVANLVSASGAQAIKAVGRVKAANVNMGFLGVNVPSATAGILLKSDEVIVIEGYDNIVKARFIEVSGGASIRFALHMERL
jgi:hypothetical protein